MVGPAVVVVVVNRQEMSLLLQKRRSQDRVGVLGVELLPVHDENVGHVIQQFARERQCLDATVGLDEDDASVGESQDSVQSHRGAEWNAGSGSVADQKMGPPPSHQHEGPQKGVDGRKDAAEVRLSDFSRTRNVVKVQFFSRVYVWMVTSSILVVVGFATLLYHGVNAIAGGRIGRGLAVVNGIVIGRIQVFRHVEHFRGVSS